jgi:orotate phosphoribosyltransferase
MPSEAPQDVKIGWSSVGVFGSRISLMASIMADIIMEESEKREFEVRAVAGLAINGISLATYISEELGIEFAVYRPPYKRADPGAMSSNYADIKGKDIVIVDDVLGTGETMTKAVEDLKAFGANPRLILAIVNKTEFTEIDGVPIRHIVSAKTLSA